MTRRVFETAEIAAAPETVFAHVDDFQNVGWHMMYSEWLNTTIRRTWTYSPLMPVLPGIGTGLSPLAQWVVVPSAALFGAWRLRWPG